jgi:hypothetical protein
MNILLAAIMDGLKKHGVVFLVLLGLILYFHQQNEKLEKKFDICNSKVIEMYHDHNVQLIEALERNTLALEKIAENK